MVEEARLTTLIPVKKMDRAIKFYTKKLGAKVTERPEGEDGDSWASLRVGGTDVWFVTPFKREKRKLAYHTLIVNDIEGYVGRLQKGGVEFEEPEKMSKKTKIKGAIGYDVIGGWAFFKDSEGNLLMVYQNTSPP